MNVFFGHLTVFRGESKIGDPDTPGRENVNLRDSHGLMAEDFETTDVGCRPYSDIRSRIRFKIFFFFF